jgi:hypothetical protein
MKIVVPLLALITIVAVGFVLVGLHAPSHVSDTASPNPGALSNSASPNPHVSDTASPNAHVSNTASPTPPVAAPPVPAPPAAEPPAAPPPAAPPTDPLDVVVRGKTRREWHAYYAERQQQMALEIARYQQVVDRAVHGEEPDPTELTEAHDKIRELNERLKEDLEALQQIDASP